MDNSADYIVTHEQVVQFTNKWILALDLSKYISITPSILFNESKAYKAFVEEKGPLEYNIRVCAINIDDAHDLEAALVHELLHIKLGRIFKLISKDYDYENNPAIEEELIENLTELLVPKNEQ